MLEVLGALVAHDTVRILALWQEEEFHLASVFHHGEGGFHTSERGFSTSLITVEAEYDLIYTPEKHF